MQWSELERRKEAPGKGTMLIYTRQRVIFENYTSLEEIEDELEGKELLEVHLFDKETEYRAIASQSRRFPKHYIENVFSTKNHKEENIYKQELLLEQGGNITVNNYISYNDDNGMAVIDGYQFVSEEGGV